MIPESLFPNTIIISKKGGKTQCQGFIGKHRMTNSRTTNPTRANIPLETLNSQSDNGFSRNPVILKSLLDRVNRIDRKGFSVFLHRQAFEIFICYVSGLFITGNRHLLVLAALLESGAASFPLVMPRVRVMLNTRCDMESSLVFHLQNHSGPGYGQPCRRPRLFLYRS